RLRIAGVTVQAYSDTALKPEQMPPAATVQETEVAAIRASDAVVLEKYEVLDRTPFTDANLDLVRTMDDVQPYFEFKGTTMEEAATMDVGTFLKVRLPMDAELNSRSQT